MLVELGLVEQRYKAVLEVLEDQMPPAVEAKVVEMRRAHPEWGPRTLLNRLARAGVEPLPSRSAVYRCLVRHVLLEPKPRKRRPSHYKRWER